MKAIYVRLLILCTALSMLRGTAQSSFSTTIDSLQGFNEQSVQNWFLQHHPHESSLYSEYINAQKRDYIRNTFYPTTRVPQTPPTVQAACTNMNFESGDLTGWTASTGFNPLYDAQGCCMTAGGAQAITSGAGTDPCGGFPVVCPGGNFSVMIGNNAVNGVADRLEQTFTVTQSNANYTYKYAVVLEDPGHTTAEQPSFQIDMLDSNGVQIPCTFYQVSAGQGIPGFQNSANCTNVVYKPWTTVSVDLSSYIGQNVTIRFTTYDCSLGGHYGYAYVDGSCLAYTISLSDSLCVGGTAQLCAPQGFQTYTWSGPGVVSSSGNCATINTAGTYSVQLTTVTGCNTPEIQYSVSSYPAPLASFGIVGGNNACSLNVGFNNTSTSPGGQPLEYLWDFGDGTSSFAAQPTHTYLSEGTYTVTLIASGSLTGCSDTTTQVVVIDFPPTPLFASNGICAGSAIQFTNQTPNLSGTETWLWSFGDNTTATTLNTNHIYAVAGNYNVSLVLTNANGCTGATTATVNIAPLPAASFTSTVVCNGQASGFTSTATISSGSIIGWQWDFNMDGVTDNTLSNASYTFPSAGSFNVNMTVTSNAGCVSSVTSIASVRPNPMAAFSTSNVCQGAYAVFQNTSAVGAPSQITQYAWSFGDNSTSTVMTPQHQYSAAGTYTVSLVTTTESGCTNPFSFPITIHPIPNTTFASPPVCHTQATQFSDQSTVPGGTIVSRAWDFNNDGIIDAVNIANPSFLYANAGTYNARLETMSNNGCYNLASNQVLVYKNPTALFSDASVCMGNPVSFNNQSTSIDGVITSYSWDFNSDGSVDNISASPSFNYGNPGTYLVTLQIQTEHGCEAIYQHPARVNPNPFVQFSVPQASACPTMCVTFTNLSSIATGTIATYLWDFGDQSVPSTIAQPSHCYNTGTYDVSLTVVSDSGCVSSTSTNGMITVFPQPVAGFAVSGDDMDILNPEVHISDLSLGASELSYSITDGFSSTDQSFTHSFNNEVPQVYTITQFVTNTYGCKDSITQPIEIKPAFTFYIPNAFSPNLDGKNDGFKGQGLGINEYRMWIFDRWGNTIFYSEELDKAWDGTFQGKSGNTVMQDVYVWKVELKDIFNKSHHYNGTVAVVR
jgi:gliding motility-associated-like protein